MVALFRQENFRLPKSIRRTLHLLEQSTPNEADASGTDFFYYQKRVVKDAELFDL
jgi:hypothetical protein